jgi:hypothetical protein
MRRFAHFGALTETEGSRLSETRFTSQLRLTDGHGLSSARVVLENERDDRSTPLCRIRVLASQENEQIAPEGRAFALRGLPR